MAGFSQENAIPSLSYFNALKPWAVDGEGRERASKLGIAYSKMRGPRSFGRENVRFAVKVPLSFAMLHHIPVLTLEGLRSIKPIAERLKRTNGLRPKP